MRRRLLLAVAFVMVAALGAFLLHNAGIAGAETAAPAARSGGCPHASAAVSPAATSAAVQAGAHAGCTAEMAAACGAKAAKAACDPAKCTKAGCDHKNCAKPGCDPAKCAKPGCDPAKCAKAGCDHKSCAKAGCDPAKCKSASAAVKGCSTGAAASPLGCPSGAGAKSASSATGACPAHARSASAEVGLGRDASAATMAAGGGPGERGVVRTADMSARMECDACADMAACEVELKSNGVQTQALPLRNGVMFVYTADTPAHVRAVQEVLARHAAKFNAMPAAGDRVKLCPECKAFRGAIASGKLTRETVNIEGGCLTLMTSSDLSLVAKLRAMANAQNGNRKS